MPYIEECCRADFDSELEDAAALMVGTGDLNYCITRLAVLYLAKQHAKNYAVISGVHAAIQDAADEFNRQVVAPYEDKKKAQNGDVYTELR